MSGDDDLLERSTRALRATPPPHDDELARARERLLAAQRSVPRPSRSRALRWVLPLAAVLAAGSALAATPGQLERVARAVSALLSPQPTAQPRRRPRGAHRMPQKYLETAPAQSTTATPVADVAPAAEPVAEPPIVAVSGAAQPGVREPAASDLARDEELGLSRRRRAERARERSEGEESARAAAEDGAREQAASGTVEAVVAPAQAPPEQPAPAPDGDLAQYRHAHQKHFRARDFAAALRAWNDYLQRYPLGTFAIEARYNRAICLVRLDQRAEARRALAPFARGDVGRGYRQAEATKLLEALE